ncbi:hypothetical protein [Cellulomonas sp. Root137]|uniref:hypothetical protein n=1 Tax=Cellulomonas sp. Root137 TaxID=1736459 RepID=UPI0006FBC098|nr:hypothetical protein [Cellulomonas sp. Root137]KQY44428.1 hypothetical protein ASD18_12925 [Cellulomonas sp. Root137]
MARPGPGDEGGYHLVAFDAAGLERPDDDGLPSRRLAGLAADLAPTDVFVLSHGWFGDVPAARQQYDRWVAAMALCEDDVARARARGFRPLVVGVHWPSKAWGDEELGSASFGLADGGGGADALAASVEDVLGGSAEVRESLRTILDAAREDIVPVTLPEEVRRAYERLDAATGLPADGEGGAPGADRDAFDAESAYQACLMAELTSFGGVSLGGLLAPLRVLTFWQMKRRASEVGARGVADLVAGLQSAVPTARVHLMGHSFGCIVVSAAVAGRPAGTPAVSTLMLVQGAMSLWSFCTSIPAAPERPGYFHRVVSDGLVDGPVLVTTSVHDRAVGMFYPLGAGARRQVDYAPGILPTYGAIGTFGVRGPGLAVVDDDLHAVDEPYDLRAGHVYNLRADRVIATSAGVMGAHSDIARAPVAHALWQAVVR